MNELTVFLAAFIALAHVLFIFWPRKPIGQPTHADGRPVLWLNQDPDRRDVACVWRDPVPEDSAPQPLDAKTAAAARSVA